MWVYLKICVIVALTMSYVYVVVFVFRPMPIASLLVINSRRDLKMFYLK